MKRLIDKNFLFGVALIAGVVLSTAGYVFAITESPGPGDNRQLTRSLDVGDPISAGNGAYRYYKPLLRFGGTMPFTFGLFYGSDFCSSCIVDTTPSDLPAEFWWTPKYAAEIYNIVWKGTPTDIFSAILGNGDIVSFKKVGTDWVLMGPADGSPASPVKYVLKETETYIWLMDPMKELIARFRKLGDKLRIAEIYNRNFLTSQRLWYQYSTWDDTSPIKVSTTTGNSINFTYDVVKGITKVEEQDASSNKLREISFSYDASNNLVSVTDPMGNTTTFNYTTTVWGDKISGITLPKGNTRYNQSYALINMNGIDEIRVTGQTDAYGNSFTLNYNTADNIVSSQRPDGNTDTYTHHSHHGPPKGLTDSTGKAMSFTKNSDEQTTSVTDRIGDTTSITYHPETGKVASITNAEGRTITHTYTAQDQTFGSGTNTATFTFYNLTRTDYPDGTNEQFTYDSKGRMLTRTDRAGKVWTFTYDSNGRLETITNPTGGVITYTYTSFNMVASIKDSETGTTTYEYDDYRRLIKINNPDGTFIQIAYNLNDQVTSITDENNNVYTYTYDANGSLTKVTDPKGNQTQYAFDLMDRVTQITNRLNKETAFAYDNMERLASITDPNDITTSLGYDPRGWRTSVTIGGRTWLTGYDDEGVVSSTTTPIGNTTTFQSDKLGFITGITNPLGQTTTFTRDSMSRVTGITDPLSRTTTYSYDNRGLLSGVTMPVIGTATYIRNDIGLLSGITDLNGNDWAFGYTNMGRPSSITDPLSNITDYTYDNRGRLGTINYPDTTTQTITYDNAGNVTQRQYSDGLTLQFTYDELERLLTANGLGLTRDPEGRIISTDNPGTAFGATYDDGGRLKTVTYNNGAFTVTYTYDSTTGLLSRVTDNLTNTQVDFTFDNDRRLTRITRSNGVNTTYTYDNAGRITRIVGANGGSPILDLQYTLDAAGQVSSVNMTAPLDPASLLIGGTDTFTYDSASQVSTAGYTYDQRGRLTASPDNTFTWNGASRLRNINGTVLSYNGLGDIITRGNIHYFYNYALGLNPIVAEKDDSTGQFLRYYVWTPGGTLLYMIDAVDGNRVCFYHFDRTGNTLALTNASGTVTDSYAYTPFGKLLGHNGTSAQPFTFVGQYGVRQDSSTGSGLYHMRARYYDAVTARFISREPTWPNTAQLKQINPYQYAASDPVGKTDPRGLFINFAGVTPPAPWQQPGYKEPEPPPGFYTHDEATVQAHINFENAKNYPPPGVWQPIPTDPTKASSMHNPPPGYRWEYMPSAETTFRRLVADVPDEPKFAQLAPPAIPVPPAPLPPPYLAQTGISKPPAPDPSRQWYYDYRSLVTFLGNREAPKKVKKVWLPRVGKWVTEEEEWEWMLEQWSRAEAAGWNVPFSVVDPWEWWQFRD